MANKPGMYSPSEKCPVCHKPNPNRGKHYSCATGKEKRLDQAERNEVRVIKDGTESYHNLRQDITIKITHLYCPLCGGYLTYQVTGEIPIFHSSFCMYCKRELHIKFDHNDVRVDVSYARSSDT